MPLDLAAFGWHRGEDFLPVVGEQKVQLRAVFRPAGRRHVSVELRGRKHRFPATHRDDRELGWVIARIFRHAPLKIGDLGPIGAEHGPGVWTFPCGELHRLRAFTSFNDVDIGVAMPVGVTLAFAGERDPFSVGRPGGSGAVETTRGQQGRLLGRDIEDVNALIAVIEIAHAVALEVIAVDHDGLGRFVRLVVIRIFFTLAVVLVLRILRHQHEPRAVFGPLEAGHATFELRQPLGFPTRAVQQPDLALRGRVLRRAGVVTAARGQESQILAVRAEPRAAFAAIALGQLDPRGAIPAHHEQIGDRAILARVGRAKRVGDPIAFGRDRELADLDHTMNVLRRERTRLNVLSHDGRER